MWWSPPSVSDDGALMGTSSTAVPVPAGGRSVGSALSFFGRLGDHVLFYGRRRRGCHQCISIEIIRPDRPKSPCGAGTLAMIGGTVVIVGFPDPGRRWHPGHPGLLLVGQYRHRSADRLPLGVHPMRPRRPGGGGDRVGGPRSGPGVTAQLGAMRITEEIDALESMASPVEYLRPRGSWRG